jgi:cytochrome c556
MRKAILAIGLAALFGAAAHADDEVELAPSTLIAIRQAGYDLQGANLGDLKRAVEAKTTEVKPFKPNAEAIVAWSKVIPSLFPKGTDKDTKALPAVWSDRAGFEKAAANLTAAAETLVKAADANDPAAFATAFKATADACGACHRPFRAK